MKNINLFAGRFQPFHKGHLQCCRDAYKKNGLKTVIMLIHNTKFDKKKPFDDSLIKKELDIIKKTEDCIEDYIWIDRPLPGIMMRLLKEKDYQPVLWLAGEDRYDSYEKLLNQKITKDIVIDDLGMELPELYKTNRYGSATAVRNAIATNDKKRYTELMPKGTDKLYNEFAKQYTQINETISLSDYVKLFEGGNAVTAQPIPAYITPLIYKEIEDKIHSYNKDIKLAPLGSIGKKSDDDFNGDIDIAINMDKDDIIDMVEEIFSDCELNNHTTPKIVSIGYPWNKEGKSGIAQVDFMFTKNIDWAKWRFSSPNLKEKESKYKADPKVFLLQHIVSSIPVKDAKDEYFEDGVTVKRHWRYTFNQEGVFKQLIDYTGKRGPLKIGKKLKEFESLVSNDPDNVMRFIFGDNYDPKDFTTVERLWKALHSDKWPWGPEACEFAERRFYNEYVNNPKSAVKLDPKDFPTKYI